MASVQFIPISLQSLYYLLTTLLLYSFFTLFCSGPVDPDFLADPVDPVDPLFFIFVYYLLLLLFVMFLALHCCCLLVGGGRVLTAVLS